jgi:hypothetical protein
MHTLTVGAQFFELDVSRLSGIWSQRRATLCLLFTAICGRYAVKLLILLASIQSFGDDPAG